MGEDDQVDLLVDAGGGQLLGQPPRRADPGGAGRPGPPTPVSTSTTRSRARTTKHQLQQPPVIGPAERLGVAPAPRRPGGGRDRREGPLQRGREVAGDVADGGDLDAADGQGPVGHGAFTARGAEVSQAPVTTRAVPATAAGATRSSSTSTPRTMATTGMK